MTVPTLLLICLSLFSFDTGCVAQTYAERQEICTKKMNCKTCVDAPVRCFYCNLDSTGHQGCHAYPDDVFWIIPPADQCPLSEVNYFACWVNVQAFIIGMCIATTMMIASITGFYLYYKVTKKKSKESIKQAAEDAKWKEEARVRQLQAEERRAIREANLNRVRDKYGMSQPITHVDLDSTSPTLPIV